MGCICRNVMNGAMQSQTEADDEQHAVDVELTEAVDDLWFAEEFEAGDQIAVKLGDEVSVAEVSGVEPADGVISVDLSEFDRDDLGGGIALPDNSTTGQQTTSHGVLWAIVAVPVDHTTARDDSVDRVICDCGTLCKAGRGHSVHQWQHVEDDSSSEDTDDEGDALPHPQDDPDLKYCHVGKQYEVFGGSVFEVVEFDPDGPCDGVLVIDWIDSDDSPRHEHRQDRGGVSRKAIAAHIDEHGDKGGVITVNHLMSEIRNLNIGEVDAGSYAELYYEQTA